MDELFQCRQIQRCSVGLAITRAIARSRRSRFLGELAPRLHPMFHSFHAGHLSGPAAVAMRIKEMSVRSFQILMAAGAGRCQRTSALRTGKEEYVRKMFGADLQGPSRSEGRGYLRLPDTLTRYKTVGEPA
jgi:hypothetical protein